MKVICDKDLNLLSVKGRFDKVFRFHEELIQHSIKKVKQALSLCEK